MTYLAWSYWEGPKSPYIEACLRTIRKHVPQCMILDRAGLDEIREQRDDHRDINLDGVCPSHRSDYLRTLLLTEFGGMWLDADTVVLKPLDDLFDLLAAWDFVYSRDEHGDALNGLLLSRKGGNSITAIRQRQVEFMRANRKKTIDWPALMLRPMEDVVSDADDAYEIPRHLVMPIGWTQQDWYFDMMTEREFDKRFAWLSNGRDPYCYMLANEALKKLPGDIMHKDSYFRHLIRKAGCDVD